MYKNVNLLYTVLCVLCCFLQYNVDYFTNFITIIFWFILILVFVTVLTIYLSNLVELFILCCSGASLLSFCTFIQFLFLFTIIIIIIIIITHQLFSAALNHVSYLRLISNVHWVAFIKGHLHVFRH